jgi:hypothetical protein
MPRSCGLTKRNATHVHKCNKCGKEIITYRDCSGESHYAKGCTEQVGDKLITGNLVLVKIYSIEEARKNDIIASWIGGTNV